MSFRLLSVASILKRLQAPDLEYLNLYIYTNRSKEIIWKEEIKDKKFNTLKREQFTPEISEESLM